MLVLASSKVTTVSPALPLTSMALTPSIFDSTFLIVIGQAVQFMSGTYSVTVLLDAEAGSMAAIKSVASRTFTMAPQ